MKIIKLTLFLILIAILFHSCAYNPNVVGGRIEKRKYNSGWHSKANLFLVNKEKVLSEESISNSYMICDKIELEKASTVFVIPQCQSFIIPSTTDETNFPTKENPKKDVSVTRPRELNDHSSSQNNFNFPTKIIKENPTSTQIDSLPFWKNYPVWSFTLLTILLIAFVLSIIGLVALQISLSWLGNAFLGFILLIVGTFIISTLLFFSLFTIFNNKRDSWKKLLSNSLKVASFILIASVIFGLLILIATSFGGS